MKTQTLHYVSLKAVVEEVSDSKYREEALTRMKRFTQLWESEYVQSFMPSKDFIHYLSHLGSQWLIDKKFPEKISTLLDNDVFIKLDL